MQRDSKLRANKMLTFVRQCRFNPLHLFLFCTICEIYPFLYISWPELTVSGSSEVISHQPMSFSHLIYCREALVTDVHDACRSEELERSSCFLSSLDLIRTACLINIIGREQNLV